jgi:predicted RNA binding protein YcfA (HicA-like mRNA interferase family)
MTDYAPDVIAILLANGCLLVRRGKGDHSIWHSPHSDRRFVVDSKIRSRHTANAIMKQAGIKHKF